MSVSSFPVDGPIYTTDVWQMYKSGAPDPDLKSFLNSPEHSRDILCYWSAQDVSPVSNNGVIYIPFKDLDGKDVLFERDSVVDYDEKGPRPTFYLHINSPICKIQATIWQIENSLINGYTGSLPQITSQYELLNHRVFLCSTKDLSGTDSFNVNSNYFAPNDYDFTSFTGPYPLPSDNESWYNRRLTFVLGPAPPNPSGAPPPTFTVSAPVNGHLLIYNSTTDEWENGPAPGTGEVNTASNVGVGGVGLFDAKVVDDLQFRNINVASTKLTVALDAGNKEVDLDLGLVNLNDLDDVNAPAPADGQVLKYDLGTTKWIPATDSTGEVNTASNQGVGGVGLFDAKVGSDLQFRNVNVASNKLSVVLDAPNKEVDLDVVPGNITLASLGTKNLTDLDDVTITAPASTQCIVRNVGNTGWVNDLVDYNTQIKNRPANRGYFDYAGSLTTAFPAVYAAGNTAYPPIGAHTASRLWINTTEKVVFFSNQTNPAFAQSGAGGVGVGANALTAYITANIGYTGVVLPTTGSQDPPVNIKFIGSAPGSTQEEPVRMVVFRVANTRSVIAVGMPVSGTIATQNGIYGGTVMTDSTWSWFKYEKFNLTSPLTIWPDILSSWTRWWFSADGQDNYAQFQHIGDLGNVDTGGGLGDIIGDRITYIDSTYSFGPNWSNLSLITGAISYEDFITPLQKTPNATPTLLNFVGVLQPGAFQVTTNSLGRLTNADGLRWAVDIKFYASITGPNNTEWNIKLYIDGVPVGNMYSVTVAAAGKYVPVTGFWRQDLQGSLGTPPNNQYVEIYINQVGAVGATVSLGSAFLELTAIKLQSLI